MVTPVSFFSRTTRACVWLLLWCGVLGFFTARVSAGEISATLQAESVPAATGTRLTLKISGSDIGDITLPEAPDLIIQQNGTQQSFQLMNGRVNRSVVYSYAVGSMKPGDYTIPEFTVTVDGEALKTKPLKLKVLPSGSQAPPGAPQGNTGPGPAAGNDPEGSERYGSLTIQPHLNGRKYAWVGEIVPVTIKVWVPQGARIERVAKIQPQSPAFTLQNLSATPSQRQEQRDGKNYTVLTYFAGLSATKAGTYQPDLTLSATARVPRPASGARARLQGGFAYSPFDDPFNQPVLKDVELKTSSVPGSELEIRPLPQKDRPADFNGAVGRFSFESVDVPDQWLSGEPRAIRAVIKGEGNFNLLSQPEPRPAAGWKAYTGQSEFSAGDAASFTGSRQFKFTAMPRMAGPQQVSLGFSYFDPVSGHYESVVSPAQEVQVRGENLPKETEAPAAGSNAKKEPVVDGLAALRTGDTAVWSLIPFAYVTSFPIPLTVAGGLLLAGLVAGFVRRNRRDPARLAREQAERAVREALGEAETFANQGDVRGFLGAARRVLQARLAALHGRPSQGITLADVVAWVPGDSPVVGFFQEADRLTYGPTSSAPAENLPAWRERLREALQSLGGVVPV